MSKEKNSFNYETALEKATEIVNNYKFNKKLNITSESHLRHFYISIKSNKKVVCNIYIKKRAFTFALKEETAKAFCTALAFNFEKQTDSYRTEDTNTIILDSKYFEKYQFNYEISVQTDSLKKALATLNKVLATK